MREENTYRQRTPCVGLCSTVFGDLVCRGCRRFLPEIVDWNRYTPQQKDAVWRRLERLSEQVVLGRIAVVSRLALDQTLTAHGLTGVAELPLAMQIHRLLGRLPDEWQPAWGIRPRPEYHHLSRRQLRELIDQELFAISEAYYRRHVPNGDAPRSGGGASG